jgi:NAD(P)-dependent dehydrogenase (short-subunit alcohol dehydrogenase family)
MGRPPERRAGVADADLDGTTALVTGSTSGIGREAALALGRLGADVFVHGRDETAGEQVVADVAATGADAQFVRADFADVASVRDLAATVREATDDLDLLLNNAGGFFREGRLTDIGVEYTFHVNHLGPYLLTAELLDLVADGGRVVTTASEAHRGGSLDLDSVTSVDSYSGLAAYNRSKLANVLFARELDRRRTAADRELTVSAVHPGAIPGSDFSRFLPDPLASGMKVLDGVPFVTSVEDGAAALLYAAVSPDTAGVSGRYFSKQRSKTPARAARDPNAARELWVRSADLLDVEEPLAAAVRTA